MTSTRIVVADPCPDTRQTLADLLRLHGFAADPVADPGALGTHLRAHPTDVVVTDTFRGLADTCRAVRAAAPTAVVMVYTAWARPADEAAAADLGCHYFLKPDGVFELIRWLGGSPGGDGFGHSAAGVQPTECPKPSPPGPVLLAT